jgi:hypothetical protein
MATQVETQRRHTSLTKPRRQPGEEPAFLTGNAPAMNQDDRALR